MVLVHGLFAHPGVFATLERRLAAAGIDRIETVAYPWLDITLDRIAARIDAVARPLAEVRGPIDLVGHSLGAVACRAWIKRFGGAPFVRRFVSLAGPHGGTSLYPLAPPGLRDALDPRGSWVRMLAADPEPVPTTVIRSRYDHQVLPPVRAALSGATEIVLTTYGHNGLLFSAAAHDALLGVLGAP
ncbi:MAG: alpha/beta fold hydrolase [Myxococcota bacterium]